MERPTVPTRIYRFGTFELIADAAELRKSGVRLKLQDQPFRVLCTLLEHPGELISREQLRQQLWPEGTFVDFEHGLNTAIKKIRDVLNDDAETPRYVETVPRKGYRFIGTVSGEGLQAIPLVAAPPVSKKWVVRAPILLVILGVLIAMAVLAVHRLGSPPYLRILATRQLTYSGGLADYSPIETDGRRVYYFKHADSRLYSVPVGGGAESSYETKFRQPLILHISPDGSLLLVKELAGPSGAHASRLWMLPTTGGPPRPLGDIEAEAAAWSPDGKAIAFARNSALYLTEDDGASYRKLADLSGDPWWIRWSPDGQRLRLTVFDAKTSVASIWEVRREGKTVPLAIEPGGRGSICCGVWTRDGRYFLFRKDRDERRDYWITEARWSPFRSGKPFLLGGTGTETWAASASPLENALFVVGNDNSRMAYKFDVANHKLTPFLPELSVQNVSFSPDGQWMLACQMHSSESVLFRARSDASEWQQLTDRKLWVLHARFSRDGKRIALMGKWPDRPWKIYWLPAEGGALRELNAPIASQADPNWMVDGQSILFGQPPKGFAEQESLRAIYTNNIQTNSTSKIPGSEGWFSPRISPDGRSFLALSIDEHKLAVYDFASSQWRILVAEMHDKLEQPSWSPDGQSVYVNVYGTSHYLLRIHLREGTTEKILSYRETFASPYCWAWGFGPDGTLLINCFHLNSNVYALRYE